MKKELYDIAEYALEKLKAGGASGATVTVGRAQTDELNVDSGEFSLMRTTLTSVINVSAIIGTKYGASGTNMLDRKSLDKTVEAALLAARSSEPDDAHMTAPGIGVHEIAFGPDSADLDAVYDRKQEFMESLAVEFPSIDLMQFITRFNAGTSLYANSNGTRILQSAGGYSSTGTFSAREGDNTTSMNGAGISSYDFTRPLLSYDFVRRTLSEMDAQLHTVPVQGKFTGTLLASPDCAWNLIYYAINNAATSTPLISKTSPWMEKLGQKVADTRLSVRYDPFDNRIVGEGRHTGDGYLSEPVDLISDGVLRSFLLSQYAARKTGLERSGNYGSGPIIMPGDTPYSDMVAGIENGLLINRFSGGMPAQNGDFSGVAKNSFLIKNGRITDAVSETMISGNLYEMLNSITGVSRELQEDGSSVMPWIAFGGVIISGK